MHSVLVDAGPLVALLDETDSDHAICLHAFEDIRDPLVTTWPVVTEAMYLLRSVHQGQTNLLRFLQSGAVDVSMLTRDDLPRVGVLMDKYKDLPMDFGDASLVRVAEREHLHKIFTLDRRDFGVYRLQNNKPFVIIPN